MKKDRILSISMLVICVILYFETFKFADKTSVHVVGPATYPRILLYIVATISIVILIKSFFDKGRNDQSIKFEWNQFLHNYREIILVFLLFGIFVVLFSKVGFVYATIFFLFTCQALLMGLKKIRSIIINLSVTLGTTFFVYIVFTNLLNVILP